MKIRLFANDAEELLKNADVLESHFIMLVLSQVIIEHLKYLLSCKHFLELQLQVQLTLKQFCRKIKKHKFMFSFKSLLT